MTTPLKTAWAQKTDSFSSRGQKPLASGRQGSVLPVLLLAAISLVTIAAVSKFVASSKSELRRGVFSLDARVLERKIATILSTPQICKDSLITSSGFPSVTSTPTANAPLMIQKILLATTAPAPSVFFDVSSNAVSGRAQIKSVRVVNLTQTLAVTVPAGTERYYNATLEFDFVDASGRVHETITNTSAWRVAAGSNELRDCLGATGGMSGESQDFLMRMGADSFGMAHIGGEPSDNHYPTAAERLADPARAYWWCGVPGAWGAPQSLPLGSYGACSDPTNSIRDNPANDQLITSDPNFKVCFISSVFLDSDDNSWGTVDARYYRIDKRADGFHMLFKAHVHYFWLWDVPSGQWVAGDSTRDWYPVIHADFGVRCVK